LVPDGLVTGLNVFATCVFLVSLLALIVFKQSVIRVILFASLVGCTFKYLQWSF